MLNWSRVMILLEIRAYFNNSLTDTLDKSHKIKGTDINHHLMDQSNEMVDVPMHLLSVAARVMPPNTT